MVTELDADVLLATIDSDVASRKAEGGDFTVVIRCHCHTYAAIMKAVGRRGTSQPSGQGHCHGICFKTDHTMPASQIQIRMKPGQLTT